jgi:hypothetical protein
MRNTVWRLRVVLVACGVTATAMGCGNARTGNGGPVVAHEHIRHAPPPPARVAAKPLVPAPVHAEPPTNAAPIANSSVDSRVLIITANGTSSSFGAIENTLDYLGTPYDTLNATTTALTADMLSSGTHGNYSAIFLDSGDLSGGFSDAEFTTLSTYEASFGVRRVSLYTSPSTDYGLSLVGSGFDPSASPVNATCTTAGRSVFVGTNCDNPVNINQGFVYPASPTDGMTIPLLVDGSGNVYAATRTYSDGREALALTFAQASFYVSYLELAYGLVDWATRGLFVGERHTYAVPQIDDLFLSSDIYPNTGTIFRLSDTDLQAFANWEGTKQTQPLTAGFRATYACNGQGSQSMPGDPLTAKAIALASTSTFAWLNHTWDHMDLTSADYATTLMEFTENDQYLRGLPLMPYSTTNAVTPDISGLQNAMAMQAIHDAGITQIVGDTSVTGEGNPSPNAGFFDALEPDVLVIGRIPSELYYDVSQPSEWIPEYEAIRSPNAAVDYQTILDTQSDALSSYMLNGNSDPWMFHQANTRNYDGMGHSLLSDLLDASFMKYGQVMTLPVVSPTMDDLAQRVRNRMSLNASGVVATVVAGTSMTVSVANAAVVPVTGLCTPGAESYAGQTISYVQLGAGQSMTYSLTGCTAGTGGTTGAAGGGGAGGAGGAGGTTGAAGAMGAAGTTGAAGNGAAGMTGAAGAAGMTGGSGAAGSGAAGTTGAAGNAGVGGLGGVGGAGEETGAGGAGEETGAGGGGEGEGDASVPPATGGHNGKGGAGEGATGGGGGQEADAGTPPPPSSGGCNCSFGDEAPGPGAFLFSLLGGGLALRGRGRRGKSAPAPRAAGPC